MRSTISGHPPAILGHSANATVAQRTPASEQAPARAEADDARPKESAPSGKKPRQTAMQAALLLKCQEQKPDKGRASQQAGEDRFVASSVSTLGTNRISTHPPVQAEFPSIPGDFEPAMIFSDEENAVINDLILNFRQNLLSLDGEIPPYTSRVTCNHRSELLSECMRAAFDKADLGLSVAGHLNFQGKGEASDQNAWEYHVAPIVKNTSPSPGGKVSIVVIDPLTGAHSVKDWFKMNDAKTASQQSPGEATKYIAKLIPLNASPHEIGSTGRYTADTPEGFEAGAGNLVPIEKNPKHEFNLLVDVTRSTMWKLFGNVGGNADNLIDGAENKHDLALVIDILLGFRASEGQAHDKQDVFRMINESISKLLPEDIAEKVQIPLTQESDEVKYAEPKNVASMGDFDIGWINEPSPYADDHSLSSNYSLDVDSFKIPDDYNIDTGRMLNLRNTSALKSGDASDKSTASGDA